MNRRACPILFGCALAFIVGCGSARVSEPVKAWGGGPQDLGEQEKRGQIAFMRKCNSCHPQGEGGLGGSLNNKPFPGTMIKAKVRGLVPGDMPKFSESEISDDEIDDIAEYLKTIRKKAE